MHILQPSDSVLRDKYLREISHVHWNIQKHIPNFIVHGLMLEAMQISISCIMDKEIVIYSYSRVQYSTENE